MRSQVTAQIFFIILIEIVLMKPENLLGEYANAVENKDLDAYSSLYDDNLRAFDMWQEWSHEGISTWRETAKGWFASLNTDKDVVTFSDTRLSESADMALITTIARFTAVSNTGEELRFLENRLTWVAQKKNGEWKIIHQHTSSPIDFDTMQVELQR